jgi:hypothetical protein
MALVSGTKLGLYQVQSAIGAGGMGEVYRARDIRLDRPIYALTPDADYELDRGLKK